MPLKRTLLTLFSLFCVLFFGMGRVAAAPAQAQGSSVELTFAFFGCNRIDVKDWERTQAENPSSANIPQLRQNLTDIAKLTPDYLFFGGDLVMGYADDKGERLRSQMSAWISLLNTLPRAEKTRYVAIAGNHELNRKVGEQKLSNPATSPIWTSLVKAAMLVPVDGRGPTQKDAPLDLFVTDQKYLSFTFTRGSIQFVVLNTDTPVSATDPQTGEAKIGMVPNHWLNTTLDSAEKNPAIRSVVVMGHRNLVDPNEVKGDAPINPDSAKPMLESLKSHKKVRAYVCAHVHAFDITPMGDAGLRQVTFGNGGSKLEKNWNPARGRTFGFGYFKVYADGSLGVIPYLRPEPKDYLDARPEQVPPAMPEAEVVIPVR